MAVKGGGQNILAGMSLAIDHIQSPDYVAGVSGWCIFQNGNAEFNSGTFRGFIVGGSLFIYSGVPALGNKPIFWIATTSLTDPFGNTLPTLTGMLRTTIGASSTAFGLTTGRANESKTSQIYPYVVNSGAAAEYYVAWWLGPQESSQTDSTGIAQQSSSIDKTTQTAHGFLIYFDALGGENVSAQWGFPGVSIPVAQPITATQPGTGTSPTNVAVAETWHPAALGNGWANAAGFAPFQYRKVASPPNSVELLGVISATAASSTNFFDLPAGYQPANAQGFAVGATGGAPAGNIPNVRCAASGALTLANAAAVPVAQSYFIHGFISLDA